MYDFTSGLNRLFNDKEQLEIQRTFIAEFAVDYRKINPQILYDNNVFYVPNDVYMIYFWTASIMDFNLGLYNQDKCNLYKRVVYPIYDFRDRVVSFCGYDKDSMFKYWYPPKKCFNKGNYIFMRKDEFIKAYNEGYVFIVDGLMDKLRFNSVNLNASAQMATTLTKEQKYYYSFIDTLIVASDNDLAGKVLYKLFKKEFPTKTILFYQNFGKDFDEFLTDQNKIDEFLNVYNKSKKSGFTSSFKISKPLR